MTKEEAVELARKREAHKPRSLVLKRWEALHTEEKGWHVALVDDQHEIAQDALIKARQAYQRGDLHGYMEAAGDAMMARIQVELKNSDSAD